MADFKALDWSRVPRNLLGMASEGISFEFIIKGYSTSVSKMRNVIRIFMLTSEVNP